ncbi:unnamed protein product [Vitrella brassicaformis CCMP3155]|uniref:Protein HGH1 homolog n=2 Tax=Vitrella brassicaformis TaxID=1169539 RepID=A0A0G4GIK1_VITBC|nr:unnamed protein product [Vitrella brassicaformis CCMP3155]|mmetsp:Transcript_5020/g.13661  ORF Transcript_5020/g.13661 Transcript_5020/m.13661 type:complete len:439 (+) Transcript_5020:163-1479(+)|eukprot:CEM29659.1 unnamed protein product [Vitrella brassicaformis CCMP3155]
MAASEEASQFEELIGFISDPRVSARSGAIDIVVGFATNKAFVDFCSDRERAKSVVKPLLRQLGQGNELSHKALTALINLAEIPEIVSSMLDASGVRRLMESLWDMMAARESRSHDSTPLHEELNLMLLANLTRDDKGVAHVLQTHEKEESRGSFLATLLKLFFDPPAPSEDREHPDRCLWVGHILFNVTGTQEGREAFLKGAPHTLNALSKQLRYTGRRPTVLQTLRHTALDQSAHQKLLADQVELMPRALTLVYPPKGPKRDRPVIEGQGNGVTEAPVADASVHPIIDTDGFGPVRDESVRKLVADIVFILGATKSGREGLRRLGAYEVLRAWHLNEEADHIRDQIENMVHLFHYEEEELDEQDRLEALRRQTQQALKAAKEKAEADKHTTDTSSRDTDVPPPLSADEAVADGAPGAGVSEKTSVPFKVSTQVDEMD